jgi:hypothetical protein
LQPYANKLGERYIKFAAQGGKGGREKANAAKKETLATLAGLDGPYSEAHSRCAFSPLNNKCSNFV